MFRTSRTARRRRAALTWLGEWRLPGHQRHAARSARANERQMQRNEERAAELQAERDKARSWYNPGGGSGGTI